MGAPARGAGGYVLGQSGSNASMRPAQNTNFALIWNWRELPMMVVICLAGLLAVNFGAVLVPVFTNAVEVPGRIPLSKTNEACYCRLTACRISCGSYLNCSSISTW
jgi:hypothetical protein